MADLKSNSTVGGAPIWHKGNFPLSPVGDTLLYKTFKVYTEFDKPQAVDNDFVSKAAGGEYLKNVNFKEGLSFNDKAGAPIFIGVPKNTTAAATYTASIKLTGSFALETPDNKPFIIFNPIETFGPDIYRLTVMGDMIARQIYDESGRVFSPGNTPSKAQVGLGLVDNAKQVQLEQAAVQTMTGVLAAPNFISTNPATADNHVARFDQIVIKDSIQDFGYYS
ncbi:hinge connector of long tail fiber protein distal connector [Salmonella phage vB_SnwM_CGG4-1]|uniref:Hinge connector n=1 Tax=Salmonella phage vB_SnwM_CGG4-1 TaxID=1815631 RepID=A0A1B0VVI8_9CAUD|nr:hinge connector of long tail fiber protein distal connector [Salmonella phage vB_SnwM_CGG4-1]ANA49590.1 hinge connector [Salmonella phage vB_SnwM_CGG4-1]